MSGLARLEPIVGREHRPDIDWRELTHAAADLLVHNGSATPAYPSACVQSLEKNGPYIVLTPGIALVHARPEDGALKVGLALLISEPVAFGHPTNDPVDLIFAFCTPRPEDHVAMLGLLAKSLGDGLGERLRQTSDASEARAVLEQVVN